MVDLQNITMWASWVIMLIGLIVVWLDFWVGVFYSTFGFIVIYLFMRLYFKTQRWFTAMEKSKSERTHGVG